MKQMLSVILALMLMTGCLGLASAESAPVVQEIVANGYMASYGIEITSFELKVADVSEWVGLKPSDFSISGVIKNEFDATPGAAIVQHVFLTEVSIVLEVEPFQWDLSREQLMVSCTKNTFSFDAAAVSRVICPELDAFTDEFSTVGGTTVSYKLYSPSDASAPLPVVIYNHGGGSTGFDGVLTDDCFACAYASAESQKIFPCYVLVPYRASVSNPDVNAEEEMAAIKAAIDQLIESGKVDAERVYMGGESMGSIYSISFVNTYPDYLAAIVLMNGGPFEIAEGTSLEEAKALDLASPWSNAELKALAESKTAVMFVQALGDTLSVPIRYATVYTKLADYGMIPGSDLIWNSYTHQEFNMLLKGNSKIVFRGIESVTTDPITGKESYQNGLCHNSSRAAGWDVSIKRWLSTRALNGVSLTGDQASSVFAGINFPDFVTKAQIISFTVEQGDQTSTFDVYAGADDSVSQVYFGFDTGYFCEIMGTVENDTVTVTYESFAGFLGQYAQPMYDLIDPGAWQSLKTDASPFSAISFPDFVTKAQIIPYTVEEGGQTATFDVYAGADEAVSQVYFGFDTGYFCEITGTVEGCQVTVTYESFAGFLGQYAQPMYDQIDPDGWITLTGEASSSETKATDKEETAAMPVEEAANEEQKENSGYIFFGGDLTSTGGSGAKIELNADKSAHATTGYFGADGTTLWATYGESDGVWETTEDGAKMTLTSKTHTESKEYTGTEAEGLLYEDAGQSWQLKYQPESNVFSGGDLTETGGNGVVINLNEDGTARLVFGYVGADGHTLYAEYSSSEGTYIKKDGTYHITINQTVAEEIDEAYDISLENGVTYQGYSLTLQAVTSPSASEIPEADETIETTETAEDVSVAYAQADSGIVAEGKAEMTFGLTSRFLWQEYQDGSIVVSQVMGGVVDGGVYSSPPVVCTYWGNVTHLDGSAHFTFDAFRWSTAYATEAEQAQMAADNPELTSVQMYINVIEDAQVTDGAYEVEFIYDLAGATTQPIRIMVQPTQTPVDMLSWKLSEVKKIVAELEAAGLREAGIPLPEEDDAGTITTDFVKNFTNKKITIHNDEVNKNITALEFIPDHEVGQRVPMVIMVHGGEGNMYTFNTQCVTLAANGIASVAFECRGGAAANAESDDADQYPSHFSSRVCDTLAVFAYVQTLDYVDPERIFLLGSSYGGMTIMTAAPFLEGNIKGLILQSTGFPASYTADGEGIGMRNMLMEKYNPKDIFAHIKGFSGDTIWICGSEDGAWNNTLDSMAAYAERDTDAIEVAYELMGDGHGFAVFSGPHKKYCLDVMVSYISGTLDVTDSVVVVP